MKKLEDIKLEFHQRPHLRKQSVEWLIEQAEKVEQLEREISVLKEPEKANK